MRDRLAQQVLAKVMGWEQERLRDEQDLLQTLAGYKYDAYENFEPGVKFVETLSEWLAQFAPEDREIAYGFVRERLIFVSAAEMAHLVRSLYPDVIRPVIRQAAAADLRASPYEVARVENSPAFAQALRRSLFLGLSDGARMDAFRRSSPDLDNEQVHAIYGLPESKLAEMQEELADALKDLSGSASNNSDATFRFVFLIDDFAGTGTTMIRRKKDGTWTGRLKKISDELALACKAGVFDPKHVNVYVCLYIVTAEALEHFERELRAFENEGGAAWQRCEILAVQRLGDEIPIRRGQDADFDAFLDRYYSQELEDKKSYKVGGKGIKYGYGACGLPLIVHHNTPNNSLYILWKDGTERCPVTPLFRRFERHRKPVDDDETSAVRAATVDDAHGAGT